MDDRHHERDYLTADDAESSKTGADLTHPYLGFLGESSAEEGTQALSGEPLPEGATLATPEEVEGALRTVHDPEIPVNIYDLGLIYRCEVDKNGDCDITMTLTAPACPVAGEMPQQVADAVAALAGIGVVTVTLTWTPPWTPDQMSDDAKLALDFF
jgi:FeS assembly SUF system protein